MIRPRLLEHVALISEHLWETNANANANVCYLAIKLRWLSDDSLLILPGLN